MKRDRSMGPSAKVAPLFDAEDADLARHYWRVRPRYGYAEGTRTSKGVTAYVVGHRLVMERALGRKLAPGEVVDHINGDRLDNRRANLRLTDAKGNAQNTATRSGSGFRGVSFNKAKGRWQAYAKRDRRMVHLGFYSTPEEAAAAAAAKRREWGFLGGTA